MKKFSFSIIIASSLVVMMVFNIPPLGSVTMLPASLRLLGGGIKFAAGEGNSALFVNWRDNYLAHHLTDGADWAWFSESAINRFTLPVIYTLEQFGFNVALAADIPENLAAYNVVIINAYYAVEPRHEPLIRDYIDHGGGVVLLQATPMYFGGYCKDLHPYILGLTDLTPIQEWFGAGFFLNSGGLAYASVDNPLNTGLGIGDLVFSAPGTHSVSAITSMDIDSQVVATWEDGSTFAFSHQYGLGRVYFQAHFDDVPETPLPVPAQVDITPHTLNLRSRGQWITAYIQLLEGYDPADIDVSTMMLNGTIPPVLDPRYGFVTNSSEYLVDHNNDGILERMVNFDRASVESLIYSQGIRYDDVALTFTGQLFEGTPFEGTDIVFVNYAGDVNNDGRIDILDAAYISAHWYPGPPAGSLGYDASADLNRDGMVSILDSGMVNNNWGRTVP